MVNKKDGDDEAQETMLEKKNTRRSIQKNLEQNDIENNNDLESKNAARTIEAWKKEEKHPGVHLNEEDEEEETHFHLTDEKLIKIAIFNIIHGTILCCLFTEPIVGVVSTLSKKYKVDPFFVSMVFSPFVLNFREIYEQIPLAKKKTSNSISMILYVLTGTCTMNNTLVLGIFMTVIYVRDLPWIYSNEILVQLIVILYVGFNALRHTIRLWQVIIILCLYPISILGLFFLKKHAKLDNHQ